MIIQNKEGQHFIVSKEAAQERVKNILDNIKEDCERLREALDALEDYEEEELRIE